MSNTKQRPSHVNVTEESTVGSGEYASPLSGATALPTLPGSPRESHALSTSVSLPAKTNVHSPQTPLDLQPFLNRNKLVFPSINSTRNSRGAPSFNPYTSNLKRTRNLAVAPSSSTRTVVAVAAADSGRGTRGSGRRAHPIREGGPVIFNNTLAKPFYPPPAPKASSAGPSSGGALVVSSLAEEAVVVPPPPREEKNRWIRYAHAERVAGAMNLQLAKALFTRVISSNPHRRLLADSGPESMILLATNAAVSCLLLDKVVQSLPRHQQTIAPFVQALVDNVFVADDDIIVEALGSVEWPEILDGLRDQVLAAQLDRDRSSSPFEVRSRNNINSNSNNENSLALHSVRSTIDSDSVAGTEAPDVLLEYLTNFARKTYFFAHMEMSRLAVNAAYQVRSRRIHFFRLPAILEMTQTSWMKRLLRTVVRAWNKVCADRRIQQQVHRARWASRWSTERLRVGIRRWRGYAAYTRQTAESDQATKALISEKRENIMRYLNETEGLLETSRGLDSSLDKATEERQSMTTRMASMERRYLEVLGGVREMDQTGTELLGSLLIHEEVSTASGDPSMMNDSLRRNEQFYDHCCALDTLIAWANDKVGSTEGKLVEQMCAMTPRQLERVRRELLRTKGVFSTNDLSNVGSGFDVSQSDQFLEGPSGSDLQSEAQLSDGAKSQVAQLDVSTLEMLNAEMPAFDELLAPSSGMVFVPLYKFLILMRCCGGADDVNAPTVETIRMVKTADSAVMEDMRDIEQKIANGGTEMRLDDDGFLPEGDGVDPAAVISKLPEEMLATAEDVCRIVVDSYGRLTGVASVFTASTLLQRRRSTLLIFLASLLRYYTNWMTRKEKLDEIFNNESVSSEGVSRTDSTLSINKFLQRLPSSPQYLGKKHAVYPEWYVPPNTHETWRPLIANQRSWIALSYSALHRAVDLSSRTPGALTLEEQDIVSHWVKILSVQQIADILPNSADTTVSLYVSLVESISEHFRRIRCVYELYAISMSRIVAMREEMKDKGTRNSFSATLSGSDRAVSSHSKRDAFNTTLTGSDRAPSSQSRTSVLLADTYITANAFWHLLCDAGIAGKPSSDAMPKGSTLHRPAVMSIVEHVVFRTLSVQPDDENNHGGMSTSSSPSPRKRQAAVITNRGTQNHKTVPQVGQAKIMPSFARAILSEQYIDLRHDRATMCMTPVQFMEALLRCAHAWKTLQGRTPPGHRRDNTSRWADFPSDGADGSRAPSGSRSQSQSTSNADIGNATKSQATAAKGVPPPVRAEYESLNFVAPLGPHALNLFLVEHLCPRVLSGPQSEQLSAFRRRLRRTAVQELLAVHQDDLYTKLFSKYSKPREAVGIRNALPPPYGAVMATLATTRQRGSSLFISSGSPNAAAGAKGAGAASGPGPQSPVQNVRDVGIVSVMIKEDVQQMAKELNWWHITESVLATCVHNVRADPDREGEMIFFPELLDLLCAVAEFTYPNPMLPLETKLNDFLNKYVLSER